MSSSAFTPTTTQVTTEVPVNVPVVTAWQSYTPTYAQGAPTGTTLSGYWRRSGDTIETRIRIQGSASSTLSATDMWINWLPSGLTIDTTKLNSRSAADRGWNGFGTAFGSFNNTAYTDCYSEIQLNTSVIRPLVQRIDSGSPFNAQQFFPVNSVNFASTALNAVDRYIEFYTSAPISQWSSGVTTLADRALEEYASNSSASDANDLTSFLNGPLGSTTPGPLTAYRVKRVRFQTSILPTDSIYLESRASLTSPWAVVQALDGGNGMSPLQLQAGVYYGIGLNAYAVNSTDIDVSFGRYAWPNGATYGAAGAAWSTSLGYWRVRKVSSGAQVGYPISTKNIVGATDGVAPVTGMLGEIVSITPTLKTASTSWTSAASSSITLQAGLWLLSGVTTNFVTSGTYVAAYLSQTLTTSGTGTPSGTTTGIDHLSSACGPGAGSVQISNRFVNVPQGSTQTWYMGVRSDGTAANAWSIYLQATRIA
jgi:hypothetical protein